MVHRGSRLSGASTLILYSALFEEFYPFDLFLPEGTEKRALRAGELPDRSDGWLIIWGGGDIHPSQYGRRIDGAHVGGANPTYRDQQEERMMRAAIEIGLPILGVCRGAQLACAVAGGVLIQHVTGHTSSHAIEILETKEKITTSSLHHQMMYPYEVDHEMIAISAPSRSSIYQGLMEEEEYVMGYEPEPEVVWFPKIKALAIQGHPEFMPSHTALNMNIKGWLAKYGR